LPALCGEGDPDEFGCLARIGGRQRTEARLGRRRGVIVERWTANLHGPTYKTVARPERKGAKAAQRRPGFMDEV